MKQSLIYLSLCVTKSNMVDAAQVYCFRLSFASLQVIHIVVKTILILSVTSNINPVLFTDESIKKFIQSIGDWFAKIQIHRIITVDGTLIENF